MRVEKNPTSTVPHNRALRAIIDDNLPTDLEFSAFYIDNFPEIYRRCSTGMDRIEKVNILFQCVAPVEIYEALSKHKLASDRKKKRNRFAALFSIIGTVMLVGTAFLAFIPSIKIDGRHPAIMDGPLQLMEKGQDALLQDDLSNAEKYIRQAIHDAPMNATGHALLANIFVERYKQTLIQFSKREAEREIAISLAMDGNCSMAHVAVGNLAYQDGKAGLAIASLERAISLDPQNSLAYDVLALSLLDLKKYEEAEAALQKAMALEPSMIWPYTNMAHIFRKQKRFDEAHKFADNALMRFPEKSIAYRSKAEIFMDQEEFDSAETYLNEAILRAPESPMYYSLLGDLQMSQKKFSSAEASYRHSISLLGANPDYQNRLGNSLIAQGNISEAVKCFYKALAVNPDDCLYITNLSISLYILREFDESKKEARRAFQLGCSKHNWLIRIVSSEGSEM